MDTINVVYHDAYGCVELTQDREYWYLLYHPFVHSAEGKVIPDADFYVEGVGYVYEGHGLMTIQLDRVKQLESVLRRIGEYAEQHRTLLDRLMSPADVAQLEELP
jgi:hypothetical protein